MRTSFACGVLLAEPSELTIELSGVPHIDLGSFDNQWSFGMETSNATVLASPLAPCCTSMFDLNAPSSLDSEGRSTHYSVIGTSWSTEYEPGTYSIKVSVLGIRGTFVQHQIVDGQAK